MLPYLLKLIQLLVYSNLFIAACAGAFIAETMVMLQLPPATWPYSWLAALATCFIYNLHYYRKKKVNSKNERLNWIARNKRLIQGLMVLSALAICLLLLLERQVFFGVAAAGKLVTQLLLVMLLIASLAYSHQIIPGRYAAWRNTGWLKVSVLSMVWATSTTIMPVLLSERNVFTMQVLTLFVQRLLFTASLVLLFNIRDYEEDKAAGINTLVVVAGPQKTIQLGKWITGLLNAAAAIAVLSTFPINHPGVYIALAIPVIWIYCLYAFFKARKEFIFVMLYDGVILVKALLLIFAVRFFN